MLRFLASQPPGLATRAAAVSGLYPRSLLAEGEGEYVHGGDAYLAADVG